LTYSKIGKHLQIINAKPGESEANSLTTRYKIHLNPKGLCYASVGYITNLSFTHHASYGLGVDKVELSHEKSQFNIQIPSFNLHLSVDHVHRCVHRYNAVYKPRPVQWFVSHNFKLRYSNMKFTAGLILLCCLAATAFAADLEVVVSRETVTSAA
jgi:hypothetical protein